jgi:hypothetical protein
VNPENVIWIFGHGRTGSSWLAKMMRDLPDHALWNEPLVGELFGNLYYAKDGDFRGRAFILSPELREVWLPAIRALVLDGAAARKPRLPADGWLVIKEPHGSLGAPLLMEALPESRLILMVRDPRDMVASALDAHREGGFVSKNPVRRRKAEAGGSGGSATELLLLRLGYEAQMRMAAEDPDTFVRYRAELLEINLRCAQQAYDAHAGPKVLVRYEDLRADTPATMERIYSALGVPVDGQRLAQVVGEHDWESIPEEDKGPGKLRRKATPGGWRDDLTAEQARTVEEITRPILEAHYPS